MFGITQEDDNDTNAENENKGSEIKTFLSQSFHGSRRRMLATNALWIVSKMGRPTIFLNLTCNIHRTEIEDQLLEGQTAYGKFQPVNYSYVCWIIKICVRPRRLCLPCFQSPIRCAFEQSSSREVFWTTQTRLWSSCDWISKVNYPYYKNISQLYII